MLRIRQSDFTTATGLAPRCASNKFKKVSWTPAPPPDGKYRTYALADTVPLLRTKHAGSVEAILASAVDDGTSYVGGDEVLEATARLEAWLGAHVAGVRERLHQVRTSFFDGLGKSVRSSGLTGDTERLRLLILRDSSILPFLISGDQQTLPRDWAAWARHFALLHSARVPYDYEIVTGAAA